jgi:hypothetical protein
MRRLLVAVALGLGLCALTVACNKKSADSTGGQDPTKPGVEAVDKPVDKPVAKPETKVADLPTEEDFEEKAHKEITKKNLKQELVEIEKSLND